MRFLPQLVYMDFLEFYNFLGLIIIVAFLTIVYFVNELAAAKSNVAAALEKVVTSNLFSNILKYIGSHLSTTTEGNYADTGKTLRTEMMPLREIIGVDVEELPTLPRDKWLAIKKAVTSVQNDSETEAKGVHPRFGQILQACLEASGNPHGYRIVHETRAGNSSTLHAHKVRPDYGLWSKQSNLFIDLALSFELKKVGQIEYGIRQALGYAAARIKDILELTRDTTRYSKSFAVGSDGVDLLLGKCSVRNSVFLPIRSGELYPLWTEEGSPSEPTVGIRILIYLFRQSPEMLGCEDSSDITIDGINFELQAVLGTGSFASVYKASIWGEGSEIALKLPSFVTSHSNTLQLEQIANESRILSRLSSASCPTIPVVHSSSSAFIAFEYNHSADLHSLLYGIRSDNKAMNEANFRGCMTAALKACHSTNICHRDIRPANIIFDFFKEKFILIDWGLADEIGSPSHNFVGGIFFFHDDLLNAVMKNKRIPYTAEYDFAAIAYISYLFKCKNLSGGIVPWGMDQTASSVGASRKAFSFEFAF